MRLAAVVIRGPDQHSKSWFSVSSEERMHSEPLTAVTEPQDQGDQDRCGGCNEGNTQRELAILLFLSRSDHAESLGMKIYLTTDLFCKAHSPQVSNPCFGLEHNLQRVAISGGRTALVLVPTSIVM